MISVYDYDYTYTRMRMFRDCRIGHKDLGFGHVMCADFLLCFFSGSIGGEPKEPAPKRPQNLWYSPSSSAWCCLRPSSSLEASPQPGSSE